MLSHFRTAKLVALAVGLGLFCSIARSQEPPKTPEVQSKQQTKSGLNNQNQPAEQPKTADKTLPVTPEVSPLIGDKKRQHDAYASENEGTEFWPPLLGYRLKVTDTLIALFTAGLFFATWLLWRATRKLVRGAEETAERQLRAYVWVKPIRLENLHPGGKIYVRLEIRNAGATPAHEMIVGTTCKILPIPLPPNMPFPQVTWERSPMVLHPGAEPPLNSDAALEDTYTTADLKEVIDGKTKGLYAFVVITYLDAFNKKRETRTCIHAQPVGGSDLIAKGGEFTVHFGNIGPYDKAT